MHARTLAAPLVLALLAACSSPKPTVTLSAVATADLPLPDNFDPVLQGTVLKAVQRCYQELPGEAVGTAVLDVRGSHGIYDVTVQTPSGDPGLDHCASSTVTNARIAKEIGDTDHFIGFVLTATYARE